MLLVAQADIGLAHFSGQLHMSVGQIRLYGIGFGTGCFYRAAAGAENIQLPAGIETAQVQVGGVGLAVTRAGVKRRCRGRAFGHLVAAFFRQSGAGLA